MNHYRYDEIIVGMEEKFCVQITKEMLDLFGEKGELCMVCLQPLFCLL